MEIETKVASGSPAFSLASADWLSIVKGALIAAAGAGSVAALQYFDAIDFGQYDVAAASLIAIIINFVRKLITNTTAT